MHVNFWLHFCYKWYKWCSNSWSYTKLLMHVRFGASFFIFNMLHARTPKIVTIMHMYVHFNFKFISILALDYPTSLNTYFTTLNSWITNQGALIFTTKVNSWASLQFTQASWANLQLFPSLSLSLSLSSWPSLFSWVQNQPKWS